MKKLFYLILSVAILTILFKKSSQSVQLSANHDADERNILYPTNKFKIRHNHLNDHDDQNEGIKQLLNYQPRSKRAFGNEFSDLSDDLDETLSVPLMSQNTVDTDSIPPWIMILLAQKMKQQREREENSRARTKTPRLGRGLDDEFDCQRSRPAFSPRLGKKSVPFKPRLGRSYEDTKR